MPVAWIASPLALCALAAAGLGLALYLFCTLKIEKPGRRPDPPGAELAELRRRLAALEAGQPKGELAAAPAEPPAMAVRPGMNLNRRSQALRLHRRGETCAEIARVLAMPASEVRLLLKVHQMRVAQAAGEPERERRLNPGLESADKAHSGVKPSSHAQEST